MILEATLRNIQIDYQNVKKAEQRAERQSMTKQLAFLRRRQRSLIRKRKRPSAPGKPPSSHATAGGRSVKMIFFSLDKVGEHYSGAVGPVKLSGIPFVENETTVPNTLETGGRYRILEEEVEIPARSLTGALPPGAQIGADGIARFWKPVRNRRKKTGRRRRWRRITVRPRPSAVPALEAEIAAGTIMAPWHNSFTE